MRALNELIKQRDYKNKEIAAQIQKMNDLYDQILAKWYWIEKESKVADEMTYIIELVEKDNGSEKDLNVKPLDMNEWLEQQKG